MKHLFHYLLFFCSLQVMAQTPASKASFDQIIDSRFKPNEPGGVVIVAKKGKIIYERAFGMANLELNVKMQPNMLFQIGSITKQFTAVCILQLMESGKLNLSDKISKYINDCPPAWQEITIENLLTHTSGISNQTPMQDIPIIEMVNLFKAKPLDFTPGTKMAYSNSGYVTLGVIIEKASGMSYPEYLQKYIFDPLQLSNTQYGNNKKVILNRVPCYLKGGNGFTNGYMGIMPSAAGALLANAQDLLKWNTALTSNSLIKKETLAKAWSSFRLTTNEESDYGYGWETGGYLGGAKIIEHSGLANGYSCDALYMPEEDIYVAVLMNCRWTLPELIAADLALAAIGKPNLNQDIALTDDELQNYTGVYRNTDGSLKNLTLENHVLYYQRADGGPKLKMIPISKTQFRFDNMSMLAIMNKDQDHSLTLELKDRRRLHKSGGIMKKIEQVSPPKQ